MEDVDRQGRGHRAVLQTDLDGHRPAIAFADRQEASAQPRRPVAGEIDGARMTTSEKQMPNTVKNAPLISAVGRAVCTVQCTT